MPYPSVVIVTTSLQPHGAFAADSRPAGFAIDAASGSSTPVRTWWYVCVLGRAVEA